MKIQTFSVVVGGTLCNARCPYCVAKMTPVQGVTTKAPSPNWRNFEIGCRFAKESGVSTVLLTGKGEPTLYPESISDFLHHLQPFYFSFIELQTNGIALFQKKEKYLDYLKDWYNAGLTTVALSVAHHDDSKGRKIYQPEGRYLKLAFLVEYLHSLGFSIRLSVIMLKNYIENVQDVLDFVDFARKNKVEQLTVRGVKTPEKSENKEIFDWVRDNAVSDGSLIKVKNYLDLNGKKLLELMHGGAVYDLAGQNICVTDCLTIKSSPDEVRQLIFFPDGHLRYDWQYPGAILL